MLKSMTLDEDVKTLVKQCQFEMVADTFELSSVDHLEQLQALIIGERGGCFGLVRVRSMVIQRVSYLRDLFLCQSRQFLFLSTACVFVGVHRGFVYVFQELPIIFSSRKLSA